MPRRPTSLGGLAVTQVEDLAEGAGGLPPTTACATASDGSARVIVRPSGTEPKLKCYLEVVVPVGPTATWPRPGLRSCCWPR